MHLAACSVIATITTAAFTTSLSFTLMLYPDTYIPVAYLGSFRRRHLLLLPGRYVPIGLPPVATTMVMLIVTTMMCIAL
jgi:hypothetical protein